MKRLVMTGQTWTPDAEWTQKRLKLVEANAPTVTKPKAATKYQGRNYDVYAPDLDMTPAQNTLKRAVGAPFAAVSDFLTDAGTAARNERAAQDYANLLNDGQSVQVTLPKRNFMNLPSSVTVPYDAKNAGLEARENFRYMTDAEKETARTKSGAELGAYVNGLNLSERRRNAETLKRRETAAALEANTANAVKRDSAQGRIVAANAIGRASQIFGNKVYGQKSAYEFLNDRQRQTISKYAEAGDFQAVAEYWESVQPDLRADARRELEAGNEAFAEKHPVVSMGTQLLSGMAGAIPSALETVSGNVRNAVTGEYRDIDPNSPAYALTAVSSAQARGAEQSIENIGPDSSLYTSKPLLSVMRGGAVSAAQNLLLLWLGGGAANPGAVNTVLGGMALSSAGQSGYEALKEGKSAGNALTNMLVRTGIETGTEVIGVERWFKALNEFDPKYVWDSVRQITRQFPAQMIAEGMEEVLGNELEQTWDMLSEGDKSEYANRIQTLQASGLSRADAAKEAAYELHVLRDAKAFAEAAFSVLLMDGVPASVSVLREGRTFADAGRDIRANGGQAAVNQTIQKGLAFDADSPARIAAEELSKKSGGKISNKELGRLSFLNADALFDVMARIERTGDADARDALNNAAIALDNDIYDKVALDDLRLLVKYARENVVTPFAQWRAQQDAAAADAIAKERLAAMTQPAAPVTPTPTAQEVPTPAPVPDATPTAQSVPVTPTQNPADDWNQRNADLPFTFNGPSPGDAESERLTTPDAGGSAAVHVGRVTTLYHPYQGSVPVQTPGNRTSVEIPAQSLANAQKNIRNATTSAQTGESGGFKSILKRLYKSVFQGANGVEVSGLTFDGAPYLVKIGNKVIGKVVSDPNVSPEKMALMEILPDVVANGEYVGSGEYARHGAKNKPVTRYDYFETPVISENRNYIAAFSVEVLPDINNFRTYEIVEMDLIPLEDRLVGKEPTPLSGETSPTDSIPQTAAEGKADAEISGAVDKNSDSPQNTRPAEMSTAGTEAETQAAAETESQAAETPDAFESGVDYNDPVTAQYARTLTRETRVRADTVLQLLGKRLRFADSVEGGAANGQISANEIVLSGAETLAAADPTPLYGVSSGTNSRTDSNRTPPTPTPGSATPRSTRPSGKSASGNTRRTSASSPRRGAVPSRRPPRSTRPSRTTAANS